MSELPVTFQGSGALERVRGYCSEGEGSSQPGGEGILVLHREEFVGTLHRKRLRNPSSASAQLL